MSRDFAARLEPYAESIRNVVAPIALVAAGSFAYRMLFDYAPYTGIEGVADETESIFFSPNESSPLLIFLVTAWLILGRRLQIRNAMGAAPMPIMAISCLAASAALYVWAIYVSASDLSVVSLILALLGAGALLGGKPGLRAIWLPALFMLMLVPVPAVLINEVVFSLQLFTARFTVAILELMGSPALEMGDLMFARGRVFQVIESCAGLRMIDTLTMSAILYVELFYRSRLQSVLLLFSAPVLGVIVNQVRVLSIVMSPQSSLAEGHTTQGIVMVVAGVLLIAATDSLLGRILRSPAPRPAMIPRPPIEGVASLAGRVGLLCAMLVLLGLTPSWLTAWEREPVPMRPLYRFEPKIDGWAASGLPTDDQFLGTAGFWQSIHRRYERGDDAVDLFVAADDRYRRRVSTRSDKMFRPGTGYRLRATEVFEADANGVSIRASLLDSLDGPVLVYGWGYGYASLWVETWRSFFGLDQSPFRRPEPALVARLSTPAGIDEAGLFAAEARLQAFLPIALSELQRLRTPPEH